jgi:hypothetical protein
VAYPTGRMCRSSLSAFPATIAFANSSFAIRETAKSGCISTPIRCLAWTDCWRPLEPLWPRRLGSSLALSDLITTPPFDGGAFFWLASSNYQADTHARTGFRIRREGAAAVPCLSAPMGLCEGIVRVRLCRRIRHCRRSLPLVREPSPYTLVLPSLHKGSSLRFGAENRRTG